MKLKTFLFTVAVVIFNVLGDLALSHGMKLAGQPATPLDYIHSIFTPWVAIGVALLILWMLSYMSLLSWADLSFVRPVTALSFALAPVMAWATLGETISLARWGGIALITLGVILVGQTAAHGHGERLETKQEIACS